MLHEHPLISLHGTTLTVIHDKKEMHTVTDSITFLHIVTEQGRGHFLNIKEY